MDPLLVRSPDRFLPPDQMRWLLAGLIAMALAGLFLYLDLRLQTGAAGAGIVGSSSDRGDDDGPRASRAPKARFLRRLLNKRSPASPG